MLMIAENQSKFRIVAEKPADERRLWVEVFLGSGFTSSPSVIVPRDDFYPSTHLIACVKEDSLFATIFGNVAGEILAEILAGRQNLNDSKELLVQVLSLLELLPTTDSTLVVHNLVTLLRQSKEGRFSIRKSPRTTAELLLALAAQLRLCPDIREFQYLVSEISALVERELAAAIWVLLVLDQDKAVELLPMAIQKLEEQGAPTSFMLVDFAIWDRTHPGLVDKVRSLLNRLGRADLIKEVGPL